MDETISGEEICTFDATTATFSITASAELSANDVYLATFQGSSGDNGENIGTLLYDCTVQAAPLTLLNCVYHSEGSSAGSITSFSLSTVVNNDNSFSPDQSKIPKITIKTTTNPVVSSSPSEITELTDTITVTFVAGTTDSICSNIFYSDTGSAFDTCVFTADDNAPTAEVTLQSGLENKEYTIYYKNECDGYTSTSATFTLNIPTSTSIPVSAVSVDSSQTCGYVGVSSITMTVGTELTGTSFKATLVDSSEPATPFEFTDCSKSVDSLTLTCSQTSEGTIIIAGTYTLSSLSDTSTEGTKQIFSVDDVSGTTLQFVDQTIADTQVAIQEVDANTLDILITVIGGTMPSIYIGEAGNTDIKDQCSAKTAETPNVFTCTLTDEQIGTLPFTLYYDDGCSLKRSTNIVVQAKKTTITVTGLEITGAYPPECSATGISSIELKTNEDNTDGTVSSIVLQKGDESVTFSTCNVDTANKPKVVKCSEITEGTISYGEYTLKSITTSASNVEYDFSSFTGSIRYVEETTHPNWNSAFETQTITADAKTFKVEVADNTKLLPSFYTGKDVDKKIKCERNAEDATNTEVICYPNDKNMPPKNDGAYTIYYKEFCDNGFSTTQIAITKEVSTNTQVTINDISLSSTDTLICQTSEILHVYITFEGTLSGIIGGKLVGASSGDKPFSSCSVTSQIITCEISGLAADTYTLGEITTDDGGIDVSIADNASSKQLKYIADSLLTEAQTKSQVVTDSTTKFAIQIVSPDVIPSFYLEDGTTDISSSCSIDDPSSNPNTVHCTLSSDILAGTGPFVIYYEDPCGVKKSTEISVSKSGASTTTEITVLNLKTKKADNSLTTCLPTAFTNIVLTTQENAQGTNINVTIKSDSQTVTFSNCAIDATTITCSTASETPTVGEFSIESITLDETTISYKFDSIADKLKFEEATTLIGVNTDPSITSQTIGGEGNPQTFTINLADSTGTAPTIYAGSDTTKEIPCERSGSTLSCTADDSIIADGASSEIFYLGACDSNPQTTGITVTKSGSVTYTVTASSISLFKDEPITCLTSLTTVYITTDKLLTGTISGKLTDSNTVTHDFTSCTAEPKLITCTISGLTPDTYQLSELTSSQSSITINSDDAKAISLTYDAETSELGNNSNQSITINDTFSIVVNDNTKIPKFYVGNSEADPITCHPVDGSQTNLNCDLTASMVASEIPYDIYYKKACESLASASITITVSAQKKMVTISKIAFSSEVDTILCSTNTKVFYLTFDNQPTGTIEGTLVDESSNPFDFSCPTSATILTCTLTADLAAGKYHVSTLTTTSSTEEDLVFTDIIRMFLNVETQISAVAADQGNYATQEIDAGNTNFHIVIADDSNAVPKIYIDSESDANLVVCSKKTGDNTLLECPTTDTNMAPDGTQHTIYYKAPCATELTDTKVKVTKNGSSGKTVTMLSMSLSSTIDNDHCTATAFTQIIFKADKVATGPLNGGIKIKDSGTTIQFTRCTIDSLTITCELSGITEQKTYVLSSLTSEATETIVTSAIDAVELKYEHIFYVGSQNIYLDYEKTEFEYSLVSSSNPVPTLYYPGEKIEANLIRCTYYDLTHYKCNTNNNMKSVGAYTIFFTDPCGNLEAFPITIRRIALSISIREISLGPSQCVTEPFSSFTLTLSKDATLPFSVEITDTADTTRKFTFNCLPSESKQSACTINEGTTIQFGIYKLTKSISTNVDVEIIAQPYITTELKYYGGLGAITTPTTIETTYDNPKFTVPLEDTTATPIKIFYENDSGEKVQITCTQEAKAAELVCEEFTGMVQGKGYEIFYSAPCDETSYTTTGITVTKKVETKPAIKPTAMTITGGATETCESIETIEIDVDLDLAGTAYKIKLNSDETEYSCTGSAKKLTCTVSLTKTGDYSIAAIAPDTGDETFDLTQFTGKVTIKSLLGENEPILTVDSTNTDFTIKLSSETSTTFYSTNDNSNPITCEAQTDKTVLKCTPNDKMQDNGDYLIYYTNACGVIVSTGITVRVNKVVKPTITPTKIEISGGVTCSSFMDTIEITFPSNIEGTFSDLVIKDLGNFSIKFQTCTINGAKLTCSNPDTSISGKFTFFSLTSSNYIIDSSAIDNTQLIKAKKILGTQITDQSVKETSPNFIVKLYNANTTQPNIYVGNNVDNKLTCIKTDDELSCETNDTVMPDGKAYEIYYQSDCGMEQIKDFTVQKIPKTKVKMLSLTLDGTEVCSDSAFTSFKISTESGLEGLIKTAILTDGSKDYSFTCTISGNDLNCDTPSPAIVAGSYTLKELTGDSCIFDINDVAGTTLKYETNASPLSTQEALTDQRIYKLNNVKLEFNIAIDKVELPSLYYGNNLQKPLSCSLIDDTPVIKCSFESTADLMDEAQKIYYKASCGKLYESLLEIQKVKDEILVSDVKLLQDSAEETCVTSPFTTVKITVPSNPGTITRITLSNDNSLYVFSNCQSDDTTITCTDSVKTIIPGTYTLYEIEGDDYTFNLSSVETKELHYKQDFLNETQLENPQIVNIRKTSFIVTYVSDTTPTTNIYLGNDDDKKEVTDFRKDVGQGNRYYYSIALSDYSEITEYDIYYKDACESIANSGIHIIILPLVETSVTSIKPDSDLTCTSEIQRVTLLLEASPNSDIEGIFFTDSEGTTKAFDQNCSHEETAITCEADEDNKLSAAGIYTLSSVSAVDTIAVPTEEGTQLTVEIKESVTYLGEQTETAPTLNNETTTFTIVLDAAITEAPKIYCGNDKTQEIACLLTGSNLECEPSEENMPESNDYEIFYEDVCGDLVPTGITVTYVKPIEDEEITIETKGGYLMYKFIIGVLLVFMF